MVFLYWILFAIISAITIRVGAEFWRWGGDGQSLWRNPGVPILVTLSKMILIGLGCLLLGKAWSWWNMLALGYIPALWGCLQAFSYGLNAPIHKFWVWVFGQGETGNYAPVEIATRCTCGFLWTLPAILFAIVSGLWWLYAVYAVFVTIACGYIWWKYQDVEIAERATGGCVSTSVVI